MLKYLLSLLLILAPLHLQSAENVLPIPAKELRCLVDNVYYESKSEPWKGQVAVALVTLNRLDDDRYPKSICKVVYQKDQFSWTKNYKPTKKDSVQWQNALDAAVTAYNFREVLGQFKATHFHNTSVKPGWKLKRVAKIGQHIFYS